MYVRVQAIRITWTKFNSYVNVSLGHNEAKWSVGKMSKQTVIISMRSPGHFLWKINYGYITCCMTYVHGLRRLRRKQSS